jgi:hypothetical protein
VLPPEQFVLGQRFHPFLKSLVGRPHVAAFVEHLIEEAVRLIIFKLKRHSMFLGCRSNLHW